MSAGFNFPILFGFSCMLFSSEAQVKPPANGENLIFAPGSNGRIQWTFHIRKKHQLEKRTWYFTSTDGKFDSEKIAEIHGTEDPKILKSFLNGVTIEGNATLVLKNVNQSYDGEYQFTLVAGASTSSSAVTVTIAVTPSVKVNCSNTMTVNKTDDVICLCEGKGGKPLANVTWYDENGEKISETGIKTQVLKLTNVNKTDRGTYTCKAKSYEGVENKTTIKLNVNFSPENVRVVFPTEMAERGKPFTMTCEADAHPPPEFQIFFNDTKLLVNENTYTITKANDSNAGFYKCTARNKLGLGSSTSSYLRVEKEGGPDTTSDSDDEDEGLSVVIIVVIVIGVLVLVLLVVTCVVCWWKKKGGNHGRSRRDKNVKHRQRTDDKHIYDSVTPDEGKSSRSSANVQHHEYAILEPPVPERYTTPSDTANYMRDSRREDATTVIEVDKI